MRTFIWVAVIVGAIECIGRLYWLSRCFLPPRTAGTTAIDCAFGFAFIAWGVWLLAT